MEIKYTLRGLKKLQDAVAAAPAVVAQKNVEAMHQAVEMLESDLRASTPTGPGHFAGKHEADSFSVSVGIAGKNVRGDVANSMPQARWRERGTKPHDIPSPTRPLVVSRALRIPVQGGVIYRRSARHPGEPATLAFKKALRARQKEIRGLFLEALRAAAATMATRE